MGCQTQPMPELTHAPTLQRNLPSPQNDPQTVAVEFPKTHAATPAVELVVIKRPIIRYTPIQ
jgi:hypothetical protein